MPAVDTRNIDRDSLFLMAELRIQGDDTAHRVKVRNLSSRGMMIESGPIVVRGAQVSIDIRNIGPVDGVVAWIQDQRFGIALSVEIDPQAARAPVGKDDFETPRFTRPSSLLPPDQITDRSRLRKL